MEPHQYQGSSVSIATKTNTQTKQKQTKSKHCLEEAHASREFVRTFGWQLSPENHVRPTSPVDGVWHNWQPWHRKWQDAWQDAREDGDWTHTSLHPIKSNFSRPGFRWMEGAEFGRALCVALCRASIQLPSSACLNSRDRECRHTQTPTLTSTSEQALSEQPGWFRSCSLYLLKDGPWHPRRENWNYSYKSISNKK